MRFSAISAVVCASFFTPNKQPLMIWGSPGVGKSKSVYEGAGMIAKRLLEEKSLKRVTDFGFIDLRLALLEQIDLRGLPSITDGVVKWLAPAFLPKSGFGIIFLDEIVQANPSMQAAASQLILDRRIGEYVLPEGWMVVAAGNRKSDKASVNAMPTHIANRFVHLTLEANLEDWIMWALRNDIDIRIIAFLKWRPHLLNNFDPSEKGEAYASCRSWEFASNLLKVVEPEHLAEVMKGAVGGAAAEFVPFCKVFDRMPDIDALLLNPTNAPIPTDAAVLYALTTALVSRVDKDNVAKLGTYFDRLKDGGRPDFAALALKEVAAKAKPEVLKTRAYCEWSASMAKLVA